MILHVYGDTIVPATLLNNCLSSTRRSPRHWLNVFHRLTSWSLHCFWKEAPKKVPSRCVSMIGATKSMGSLTSFPIFRSIAQVLTASHEKESGAPTPPYVACGQDALSSILFKWCSCKERIQNIAQIPDLIDSNSWNDLINLWGFGGMMLIVAETARKSPPVCSTFLLLFHLRNAETARPMRMTRTTRALCPCTQFNTREHMKTSQRTKEGKEKNT